MHKQKSLDFFYASQILSKLQKIGSPNDDSLKYKALVSSMSDKYISDLVNQLDVKNFFLPSKAHELTIKKILNQLIQAYENQKKITPANFFNFTKVLVENYFSSEIRSNLPIACKEVQHHKIAMCYHEETSRLADRKNRDKYLEKNIRAELDKKSGVAFFAAGRFHTDEMARRMPNEPRMAILNWTRI